MHSQLITRYDFAPHFPLKYDVATSGFEMCFRYPILALLVPGVPIKRRLKSSLLLLLFCRPAIVREWRFKVVPDDDTVETFGPNRQPCYNGGVAVDAVEYDQMFTCDCGNTRFVRHLHAAVRSHSYPHVLHYGVVSILRCVLPCPHRKTLEPVFNLMTVCEITGGRTARTAK